MPKKIQIKQHLPPEEIRRLYKKEKDKKKAIRLLAIYHLMKGKNTRRTSRIFAGGRIDHIQAHTAMERARTCRPRKQ